MTPSPWLQGPFTRAFASRTLARPFDAPTSQPLAQQVAALFRNGEQGAWYEPSLTNGTLFQDAAGTTPVTAVGQPVGRMLDKSGRGNHATQPTAINRPVLQIDGNGRHFLAFNGTNSWMSTPAIDFTGTDKLTVIVGARKLSDAATGILLELSASININNGTFVLYAPRSTNSYSLGTKGTALNGRDYNTYVAPHSGVISATASSVTTGSSATSQAVRINGEAVTGIDNSAAAGTGNYSNSPLYLGTRGSTAAFFNGNFYGLVLRGALSTTPQIASAERFMAQKTGVTL